MTEPEHTTFRIRTKAAKTLREFLTRTSTDGTDFFDMLMEQLQIGLDLRSPNKRLLWLVDWDEKNHMLHLRLSDNLDSSLSEIPEELKERIFSEFGYRVVNGHFIDTREKKTEEKKEVEK